MRKLYNSNSQITSDLSKIYYNIHFAKSKYFYFCEVNFYFQI
mgnify:FL=1